MNFLEALEELDQLNEVNLTHQIRGNLSFKYNNGKCPGCGTQFTDKNDYRNHLANDCEAAETKRALDALPARVKIGHGGRSWDTLTNINAGDFRNYIKTHNVCEICGNDKELHPDHKHAEDGSHTGTFRGVLCNKCNLLLGQLEPRLDTVLNYLDRGQQWESGVPSK